MREKKSSGRISFLSVVAGLTQSWVFGSRPNCCFRGQFNKAFYTFHKLSKRVVFWFVYFTLDRINIYTRCLQLLEVYNIGWRDKNPTAPRPKKGLVILQLVHLSIELASDGKKKKKKNILWQFCNYNFGWTYFYCICPSLLTRMKNTMLLLPLVLSH